MGNTPNLEQLAAQIQTLANTYKTIRIEKVKAGLLVDETPQMPNPSDLNAKLKRYQDELLPKLKQLGSPAVPSFSDEEKAFLAELYQQCQLFLKAFPKLNELVKTRLQSLLAPAQAAAKTFENFQNGLFKKEGGGDSVMAKPTKAGSANVKITEENPTGTDSGQPVVKNMGEKFNMLPPIEITQKLNFSPILIELHWKGKMIDQMHIPPQTQSPTAFTFKLSQYSIDSSWAVNLAIVVSGFNYAKQNEYTSLAIPLKNTLELQTKNIGIPQALKLSLSWENIPRVNYVDVVLKVKAPTKSIILMQSNQALCSLIDFSTQKFVTFDLKNVPSELRYKSGLKAGTYKVVALEDSDDRIESSVSIKDNEIIRVKVDCAGTMQLLNIGQPEQVKFRELVFAQKEKQINRLTIANVDMNSGKPTEISTTYVTVFSEGVKKIMENHRVAKHLTPAVDELAKKFADGLQLTHDKIYTFNDVRDKSVKYLENQLFTVQFIDSVFKEFLVAYNLETKIDNKICYTLLDFDSMMREFINKNFDADVYVQSIVQAWSDAISKDGILEIKLSGITCPRSPLDAVSPIIGFRGSLQEVKITNVALPDGLLQQLKHSYGENASIMDIQISINITVYYTYCNASDFQIENHTLTGYFSKSSGSKTISRVSGLGSFIDTALFTNDVQNCLSAIKLSSIEIQ